MGTILAAPGRRPRPDTADDRPPQGPRPFGWGTVSGRTTTAANLATTTWVRYGTTSSLGRITATVALDAPSWEKGVDLSVSGPAAGTTHHYRFVARNALGTSDGPIRTFQTLR
jgi:hypothetical protein